MSKVQVIVTGHGTFADGFKGALHLLASVPDNWSFVNFSEGMSDKQRQAKFETILGSDPKPTLFFTDLAGGTPYKVAATLASKNPQLAVVSGCNLGSLLESVFSDYDNADAYADAIIAASKQGTQKFTLDMPDNMATGSDDGI